MLLLPTLRIHSSWKKSLPGCSFWHSPPRCPLTESCMNKQLSSKSGKRQTKEMRGKMASETFRESLWQDQDQNWDGNLRYQTCLLSADSSAQVTGNIWSMALPCLQQKIKENGKPWQKSVVARNPKPLRNNTFPLWSCSCSVCAPFFFLLLLHNAPALIQKCCQSVHTTEISRALARNFHVMTPFVLPLAFLHAWKYYGFRVQTVKSCHPKHNAERAEFTH